MPNKNLNETSEGAILHVLGLASDGKVRKILASAFSSVTAFIGLSDAPSSYTGQAGKTLSVNAGETGLEFVTPPSGGGAENFTDLADTPADYTGQGGKAVAVNPGATGLEFVDFPAGGGGSGFTDISVNVRAITQGLFYISDGGGGVFKEIDLCHAFGGGVGTNSRSVSADPDRLYMSVFACPKTFVADRFGLPCGTVLTAGGVTFRFHVWEVTSSDIITHKLTTDISSIANGAESGNGDDYLSNTGVGFTFEAGKVYLVGIGFLTGSAMSFRSFSANDSLPLNTPYSGASIGKSIQLFNTGLVSSPPATLSRSGSSAVPQGLSLDSTNGSPAIFARSEVV